MDITKEINSASQGANGSAEVETEGASAYAPRKMTFAENLVMTIKILAGFGLVGVALWAISFWTSAT